MKLYLVRHATAADVAFSDAQRALTLVGEAEARTVGTALAKLGAKPTRILASPLVRAQQTAILAAQSLKFSGKVETLSELENGATTEMLWQALPPDDAGEIVLVGHMPSLTDHLVALASLDSSGDFGFSKGSIACVDMHKPKVGAGKFLWLKHLRDLR